MPSGQCTLPRRLPKSNSPTAESSPSSGALDDDFAGSQDRSDSDSCSSKSSSSGNVADPDYIADDSAEHGDVDAKEFEKFFNNNDNKMMPGKSVQ